MKREDKSAIINEITAQIKECSNFYLTDTSAMNAADTSNLRRACFQNNISLVVVKNSLLSKALEKVNISTAEFEPVLHGHTAMMFCQQGNEPAKLIKKLRKKNPKPILKAAYIEESLYIGDNQLETLINIKSKNELIGDVISLLQSPIKRVISQLQSGGTTIMGVLETLSNKEEK